MAKSKIKCMFFEPTEFAELALRRYKGVRESELLCPASGLGYHNATVVVVPQMPRPAEYPNGCGILEHPDYPHTDPRWPKACPCGYEFQNGDHWQINIHVLYSNPEMNGLIPLEQAPVGAMWDAWWYHFKGPDGRCLVVRTPGGDWVIDAKAQDGRGWTRTGEPPELTVKPSIGIGGDPGKGWKYHGFLTNGYLEEC